LKAVLIAIAMLLPAPALGQVAGAPALSTTPPAPFTYLSAKDIEGRVGHPGLNGAAVVSMIDNHEYYFSEVVSRATDGTVERHDHWIDFITILSGEVQLAVGGALTGATVDDKGESHGGVQAGPTLLTLQAGDYVEIPAGTPHRMISPKNLRYLVVKVRV
jgi:quercetin dioxygenase-like cupin family protein